MSTCHRWAFALALVGSTALAQQLGPPAGIPDGLKRLLEEANGAEAPGAAVAQPSATPAAAKAGPSPLLQAYLKLKFDRRPASIRTGS